MLEKSLAFYITRVDMISDDADDVCFCKQSGHGFILPNKEEGDSVNEADIHYILPQPQVSGSTAHVVLKLKFDTNRNEVEKW